MNEQFWNALNLMSVMLSILNYNENLSQNDKQDIMGEFQEEAQHLLGELHSHLADQDNKINKILEKLEIQDDGQ